jgi:predicted TIM-barrel fold metal-dependent hydrolase
MMTSDEAVSENLPPNGGVIPFANATDCHVHVFGPQEKFGYIPNRRYTPLDAGLEEYLAVARPLGLERLVLTAPSVHGLDNSALLDAMSRVAGSCRAVVMVDVEVDDETLQRYHAAGVRGIRTQLKPDGGKPLGLDQLHALAHRIRPLGWHVEIHVDVSQFPDIDVLCADFPVPVVIEHMGHMKTSFGVDAPGFEALTRFLREQNAWIKLSGAYINSVEAPPHRDVRPFVLALLEAAPGRAVWGSNWPHPHQDPVPDDRGLLSTFAGWVDDERMLRDVLVNNPAALYDFPL